MFFLKIQFRNPKLNVTKALDQDLIELLRGLDHMHLKPKPILSLSLSLSLSPFLLVLQYFYETGIYKITGVSYNMKNYHLMEKSFHFFFLWFFI